MKPKLKKAIIIVLPVVFALAASVAIALMVGGGMKKAPDPDLPSESGSQTSEPDHQVDVPPESEPEGNEGIGLEYIRNGDGTCTLSGLGSCVDTVLVVPSASPDGETVVAVADRAFKGERSISKVILPETVMEIGDEAFRSSGITSITVGGSVLSIGNAAFAECLSLTEIEVSGANPIYTSASGVLFDREMETLICYPSGRPDSSYTIPKSVTRIEARAFSGCSKLRSVKFGGTEKQWKKVYVCSENSSLDSVTMTFAPEEK